MLLSISVGRELSLDKECVFSYLHWLRAGAKGMPALQLDAKAKEGRKQKGAVALPNNHT